MLNIKENMTICFMFVASLVACLLIINVLNRNYEDEMYQKIPRVIMKKMNYDDFEAFQYYKFPENITTGYFFNKTNTDNNGVVHVGKKEHFVNFYIENPVSEKKSSDYFNMVFDTTNLGCSLTIQRLNIIELKDKHLKDILINGVSMKETKNPLMVRSEKKWRGCAPLNKNGSKDTDKIKLEIQTYFEPH